MPVKPVHYHLGTMLIGTGDAIERLGQTVVELGWLVRQGGALMASTPPGIRRTKAVPPRHPMYRSNGELDGQV